MMPESVVEPRLPRYLRALSDTGRVTHACKAVGVSRDTVWRWRARFPGFAQDEREVRDRLEVERDISQLDASDLREQRASSGDCPECGRPIPRTRSPNAKTCSRECGRSLHLWRQRRYQAAKRHGSECSPGDVDHG